MGRLIKFREKRHGNKTEDALKKMYGLTFDDILNKYGQAGVDALRNATPRDSGETANSWYYEIIKEDGKIRINWNNSHVEAGWANIAILLQYGHGTRNGGYVEGRDYINPALQDIFDKIADSAWQEVVQA